jgi:hypothetical protein
MAVHRSAVMAEVGVVELITALECPAVAAGADAMIETNMVETKVMVEIKAMVASNSTMADRTRSLQSLPRVGCPHLLAPSASVQVCLRRRRLLVTMADTIHMAVLTMVTTVDSKTTISLPSMEVAMAVMVAITTRVRTVVIDVRTMMAETSVVAETIGSRRSSWTMLLGKQQMIMASL